MIGRNSSASSSLLRRGGGFGVDSLEQARKHLLLDLVNRRFEAFDLAAGGFAASGLADVEAVHRAADRVVD